MENRAGMNGTRDLEVAALERLTRLGGERLASDLAAIYLDELPERLSMARTALRARDAAGLALAVHAMKSSSAQLGAEALANACEATEDAAERGDLRRAEAFFDVVENHAAAFSAWLAGQTGIHRRTERGDVRVGGPVIALVEDNADNRLLVDAILGDRFVLHEYASGVQALATMPARRPDLVLLDVSLPGMDGLEVLACMRRVPELRDIPVVALTAHAMAGDREHYLESGFDDYVAKPIVDEDVLVDTIERLLARSRPDARPG